MHIPACLVGFCLFMFTSTAFAEAVYNTPKYDPASKSYFELVKLTKIDVPNKNPPELNWGGARDFASRRVYKGARGRLATIKNAETHSFIMLNLQPRENTVIGLRYFCKTRSLQWSDGASLDPKGFQAWDVQWDQSAGVGCKEHGYMSVAYTGASRGFRWIAKGALKAFYDVLIEYPTGQP